MEEVVNAVPLAEELGQPQTMEAEQEGQQASDDPKERQWRELRKSKDETERRYRELEQKNRMQEELLQKLVLQSGISPQSHEAKQAKEDIREKFAKEDFISGPMFAEAFDELKADYGKQLAEIESRYKRSAYDDKVAKLKARYPDLEDVVNLENIKLLAEQNPELAETWKGLDDYTIYVQAYPQIKNSGILGSRSTIKARETEKKIEENKKTVQSAQVFDKRPMAQAFDYSRMTAAQKEDLNNEMTRYAALAGGVPTIG